MANKVLVQIFHLVVLLHLGNEENIEMLSLSIADIEMVKHASFAFALIEGTFKSTLGKTR